MRDTTSRGAPHASRQDVGTWLHRDARLGTVGVAVGEAGLVRLVLADSAEAARAALGSGAELPAPTPEVDEALAVIRAPWLPLSARLAPIGTPFQRRVWAALCQIPAGSTTTYAGLAEALGVSGGARAVGCACGANPFAVVVPCHRVWRADGTAGGYRWGLARKHALVDRERAWRTTAA